MSPLLTRLVKREIGLRRESIRNFEAELAAKQEQRIELTRLLEDKVKGGKR